MGSKGEHPVVIGRQERAQPAIWQSVVYFTLCCVEDLEEDLRSLNVTASSIDVAA